jgi:hypothetical protein
MLSCGNLHINPKRGLFYLVLKYKKFPKGQLETLIPVQHIHPFYCFRIGDFPQVHLSSFNILMPEENFRYHFQRDTVTTGMGCVFRLMSPPNSAASLRQDLPSWIDAHVKAFAFFGGVPEIVVPDNLKAGVSCGLGWRLNRNSHLVLFLWIFFCEL